MTLAYNELNIPRLLEAEELNNPRVDEQSVMTYISYFRNAESDDESRKQRGAERNAARSRAYGPGLVEAVAKEDAPFVVESPVGDAVTVEVKAPNGSTIPCTVGNAANQGGKFKRDCKYVPTDVGEHLIHVKLAGIEIPGSPFHANVLAAVSLGGEGKIRVFYSTTSSSEKGRSDVINLQRLLEAKKVHLRPDFEPWIPVDIMEKEDRDAVFKKAGTKNLPIVFIDDVYIGDNDTCQELEETGKLNNLLKYNERR
jgi:glutaredoxin